MKLSPMEAFHFDGQCIEYRGVSENVTGGSWVILGQREVPTAYDFNSCKVLLLDKNGMLFDLIGVHRSGIPRAEAHEGRATCALRRADNRGMGSIPTLP